MWTADRGVIRLNASHPWMVCCCLHSLDLSHFGDNAGRCNNKKILVTQTTAVLRTADDKSLVLKLLSMLNLEGQRNLTAEIQKPGSFFALREKEMPRMRGWSSRVHKVFIWICSLYTIRAISRALPLTLLFCVDEEAFRSLQRRTAMQLANDSNNCMCITNESDSEEEKIRSRLWSKCR